MRISRGNEVIGEWSISQVKKGIVEGGFLPTDCYYNEESSEWLPLADLLATPEKAKVVKSNVRPCYCGSGLPFHLCHGGS